MASAMDLVHVDVDAPQNLFGAQAIQLPAGVGELIPNLLFIGPHAPCDEMVNRFGVRYIIDVLDDDEVIATARQNGYEEKSEKLEKEIQELQKRIKDLEEESLAELGKMDVEEDETAEAETSLAVATTIDTQNDDDDNADLPEISANTNLLNAEPSPSKDSMTVEQALAAKKRYLQLVANLRSGTVRLEELEKEKQQRLGAKDENVEKSEPEKEGEPSGAEKSTQAHKKKSDYVRYQDCNVISPVTATEGYRVVYPKEVSLIHLKMKDALIEDLTRVLHMGTLPTTIASGTPKPSKNSVDEVASDAGRGPNAFVTMEELLAAYPTPTYQPPYELVDHIDAILSQNPSERDLSELGAAAIRKLAAAARQSATASAQNDKDATTAAPAFDREPTITRHAVYIHCYAGKSRSAAIASAYSMMSKIAGNKKLDEVMDLLMFMTPITIKRPQGYVVRKGQGCRPNPRFMRDLIALEQQIQNKMQAESGIPASRQRPYETAFDIDTFNVEGLIELFNVTASPNAQIPEAVIVDTYEKVCQGDVIKARRLLVAEQTRLLLSPKVRQDMIIDNITRVLDQDIDYYVLARQKASEDQQKGAATAEDRKKIEERLKSLHFSFPRHVVAQVLEQCEFSEDKAIAKLREMRKEKATAVPRK